MSAKLAENADGIRTAAAKIHWKASSTGVRAAKPEMAKEALNHSLLDKLQVLSEKPGENVEGIRTVASKLHWQTSSQDKQARLKTIERIWLKGQGGLPLILGLIETVRDPPTIGSLAGIIHECVSIRAGKVRSPALNELVQLNATQILIKILYQAHARDHLNSNEAMGHELLWALSQLAQRDNKFSLKTRLLGAVKTFHYFLKSLYNNSKLLFPVLLIIKALARNTNTATVLAKDGLIGTMEKVLTSIGLRASSKMRLALNIMSHLSKNKLCCARIVQSHSMSHLLKVVERWERYDGKLKTKLVYYAVVSLQRVCYLKAGRKAIMSLSGMPILYKFCQSCPDDKAFDSIFSRVCSIISYCLERRFLPLDDQASPLSFALPTVNSGINTEKHAFPHEDFPEFDDGDSEDDMPDEGEEDEGVPQIQGFDSEDCKVTPATSAPRHREDLLMYSPCLEHLFPSRKNSWEQRHKRSTKRELLEMCFGAGDSVVSSTINAALGDKKIAGKKLGLELFKNLPNGGDASAVFSSIASRVRSVLPIIKLAYPDLQGATGVGLLEPLHVKDHRSCRQRLRSSVEKAMNHTDSMYEVVYDLDNLAAGFQGSHRGARGLQNDDKRHIGKRMPHHHLHFESRFESGNLRKAVQVGPREYELILTPDVNSSNHHFWFYFEVRNMDTSAPYVFKIVNCEKINSQFNYGMKPLLYSVQESLLGRPGWARAGRDIFYYSNSYRKMSGHKCYFTATFTVDFPHDYDVCYMAYHFPYTYSHLLKNIYMLSKHAALNRVAFRADPLCETLNGNEVPVLTIAAQGTDSAPLYEREIVFLTGRVHPGESNASWTLDGSLEFLVSNAAGAIALRRRYVFVVIPMLNVEGVVNGCSRCGLTNEDLNRRWKAPHPILHPEIYHAKGLLEYCCRVLRKPPFVFCDFHGHSRKKNLFFYGCASEESWADSDRKLAADPSEYLLLAHLMAHLCPAFSYYSCKFRVERGRESTARVAVWRDFAVKRSYTMEATYCGCDQGPYSGHHLDTIHLQEAGRQFCEALGCLQEESTSRLQFPVEQPRTNNRPSAVAGESDSSSDHLTDEDDLDSVAP